MSGAVFFDVDGVLIDSLSQHLQICRDKAREFGLDLRIPTEGEFRHFIGRGIKISPMLNFFLAVGFPLHDAERAVADYEREFMSLYRPKAFPGIDDMLGALRDAGWTLGLVTSNTRANVVPALGPAMKYFEPSAVFFFDEYSPSMTKAECLAKGAHHFALQTSNCVYVGDQPADAAAASEAKFRFLGVTYGWGIESGAGWFDTAKSIDEIPRRLVAMYAAA